MPIVQCNWAISD